MKKMSETANENANLLDKKQKNEDTILNAVDLETSLKENETEEPKMERRRKDEWDRRKLYEVLLLEEIPVSQRPNEPTHAVLEGELSKVDAEGQPHDQNVRNQALIHYIADLASSNNPDDVFDYMFVESLLRNGADINCSDPNLQTIFHEVARSWSTDVARFLLEHGANVNLQDKYGRSPLHVAAAVDYAKMVEFILHNGGDINIKTIEEQTAMHFAAKSDATNALQMLLGYGANIDCRDCRKRSPLQVAAEMNRFKAAKLLVIEGAPAGVYDAHGNSALSLLIEKLPEVAVIALDQFRKTDFIKRREFFFLNHLEGARLQDDLLESPARSPLEVAVQNKRFHVITHPVMRRLIAVKWSVYGKRGAILDLVLNLIYTVLWTADGVTVPRRGRDLYLPIKDNIWRFVIQGAIVLFTLFEIKKQITKFVNSRKELVKWREWRVDQLQQDRVYCHPRWPQESKDLESEITTVERLRLVSSNDKWVYFDWVCLFLVLAAIMTGLLFFVEDNHSEENTHWKVLNNHTTIVMLLILWLRMFKYARPFENAGPFVVIFSSVVGDIMKWATLNCIILIPFTCAFWIEFGANSLEPSEHFSDVASLVYNIFRMSIISNYDEPDPDNAVSRILCASFILVVAIITLNLLIALVTNTFERHYENAVENALMQRACTILLLQSRMSVKELARYYDYIKKKASPQIVPTRRGRMPTANHEDRVSLERVYDDVQQIKVVLAERFGKRFGKRNKSDLEIVRRDLEQVKMLNRGLVQDIKLILYGVGMSPSNKEAWENCSRKKTDEMFKDKNNDDDGDNRNNNRSNSNSNNNNKDDIKNNDTTMRVSNTHGYNSNDQQSSSNFHSDKHSYDSTVQTNSNLPRNNTLYVPNNFSNRSSHAVTCCDDQSSATAAESVNLQAPRNNFRRIIQPDFNMSQYSESDIMNINAPSPLRYNRDVVQDIDWSRQTRGALSRWPSFREYVDPSMSHFTPISHSRYEDYGRPRAVPSNLQILTTDPRQNYNPMYHPQPLPNPSVFYSPQVTPPVDMDCLQASRNLTRRNTMSSTFPQNYEERRESFVDGGGHAFHSSYLLPRHSTLDVRPSTEPNTDCNPRKTSSQSARNETGPQPKLEMAAASTSDTLEDAKVSTSESNNGKIDENDVSETASKC